MLQMNACWSAVYNTAGAASLLGALPLDVYRVIFRALDYATLRDACRMLNSVLAPVARQTLDALRYTLNATDAVPLQRTIDVQVFYACAAQTGDTQAAAAAPACTYTTMILRACALPLGGFLLLLRVCCGTDDCRLLLASFNAQAKLMRVLPLRLGPKIGAIPLQYCTVRFLYAHRRCVYILLQRGTVPPTHVMVRYTLDADEFPLVRAVPRALTHDVPRDGPQRWTKCTVETCAVASNESLRLVLCCRGQQTVGLLDQVVMLEMDSELNVRRVLTLCAPTRKDLAHCAIGAPWPDSGRYSGLEPQCAVDTHGRYVFLSKRVGAHAALLLFEPQCGVLLACMSLYTFETGVALGSLMTAEPHASLYVFQPRHSRAVRVSLGESVLAHESAQYLVVDRRAVVLDDGYVLVESHVRDKCLVLCKQPLRI